LKKLAELLEILKQVNYKVHVSNHYYNQASEFVRYYLHHG
jgi:hypothetical protein